MNEAGNWTEVAKDRAEWLNIEEAFVLHAVDSRWPPMMMWHWDWPAFRAIHVISVSRNQELSVVVRKLKKYRSHQSCPFST